MGCQCGGEENHQPWCAKFVAGVDTKTRLPLHEREIAALRVVVDRLLTVLDPDVVERIILQGAMKQEEVLRRDHPDHPSLARLDEWRRKQARGFE